MTQIIRVHSSLHAGYLFDCQPPNCYCLSAQADIWCHELMDPNSEPWIDPLIDQPTHMQPIGKARAWPTARAHWFEHLPEAAAYPNFSD
jgi:hypothetical protein